MNTDSFTIHLIDYLTKPFVKGVPNSYTQEAILKEFGYEKTFSGFIFNPSRFSRAFCRHVTLKLLCNGDELAIYNHVRGIYELDCEEVLCKLIKWAMDLSGDQWTPRMADMALKAIKHDTVEVVESFNTGEYIVVDNGVLDLEDGNLHPYNPKYLSTVRLPFSYNHYQKAPRFDKYLDEVTCGDDELKCILQEFSGYCLSNSTAAEKAGVLLGTGCNGKSVYAGILQLILGKGNYANSTLSSLNSTFGLEPLVNARVCIATENDAGKINTSTFKALISGDSVEINRKYKKAFTVRLSTKLVMIFNELPKSNDDLTHGFFRKLLIIPFRRTFKPEEIDRNLLGKLEKELPGILFWAVEGLKRLKDHHYQFSPCRVCDECLERYKASLNPVSEFIEDCYVLKAKHSINKSDIYLRYLQYCEDNAQEVVSRQRFWKLFYSHVEDRKYNLRYKKIHGYEQVEGLAEKNLNLPPCGVETTKPKKYVKENI